MRRNCAKHGRDAIVTPGQPVICALINRTRGCHWFFEVAYTDRIFIGEAVLNRPDKKCAQRRQVAVDCGRLARLDDLQILFVVADIDRRNIIGVEVFVVAAAKPNDELVEIEQITADGQRRNALCPIAQRCRKRSQNVFGRLLRF